MQPVAYEMMQRDASLKVVYTNELGIVRWYCIAESNSGND